MGFRCHTRASLADVGERALAPAHREREPASKAHLLHLHVSCDDGTGALTKGLVLRLYYKRNTYKYTVYHQDSQTGKDLVDPPEEKEVKYQTVINVAEQEAKEIAGYTYVFDEKNNIQTIAEDGQKIYCKYTGLKVLYQYQVLGGVGATIDNPTDEVVIGSEEPDSKTLSLWNDGYVLLGWYYAIEDGELLPVPEGWLSNNDMTVTLPKPQVQYAGKTVYVYADVIPMTRRFRVEGFASSENDPQPFVFRLQGKAGTATAKIDLTFVIFDTGYIDIERLPYGEYTLTTLHWAWRYGHPEWVTFNGEKHVVKNETVTLKLETQGDVVIKYGSTPIDKWLSDDASGIVSTNPNDWLSYYGKEEE